eukprot:GILI01015759.1.p1 GENE.GILI01015759.1~~GILI01015759.1.p1  ORF type:complete len:162 (-),score=18.89 GILI01015759.1:80-565(-)
MSSKLTNSDDGPTNRVNERIADRIKRSLDPNPSDKRELVEKVKRGDIAIPIPAESNDPFMQKGGTRRDDDITKQITKALRINESTNNEGETAMTSLGKQREVLQRTVGAVHETNDNLWQGKRILRDMKLAMWKERIIKGGIIAFLLCLIFLIIYVKWIRRR